jgi:hypothetical protein
MHLSRTLLTAIPLLGTVLFGQSSGQEKGHADHMEHRFDNPKQLAKSFDDPARDAWQMPDRVVEALGLKRGTDRGRNRRGNRILHGPACEIRGRA